MLVKSVDGGRDAAETVIVIVAVRVRRRVDEWYFWFSPSISCVRYCWRDMQLELQLRQLISVQLRSKKGVDTPIETGQSDDERAT